MRGTVSLSLRRTPETLRRCPWLGQEGPTYPPRSRDRPLPTPSLSRTRTSSLSRLSGHRGFRSSESVIPFFSGPSLPFPMSWETGHRVWVCFVRSPSPTSPHSVDDKRRVNVQRPRVKSDQGSPNPRPSPSTWSQVLRVHGGLSCSAQGQERMEFRSELGFSTDLCSRRSVRDVTGQRLKTVPGGSEGVRRVKASCNR